MSEALREGALEGAAQMLDGIADSERDVGSFDEAAIWDAAARVVRQFSGVARVRQEACGRGICVKASGHSGRCDY